MSVVDSCSDDDSIADILSMDDYNHRAKLKNIRDKNESLMELVGHENGPELREIQSRFHSLIYNYTKKTRHVLEIASYVENAALNFFRIEALVRG
jgi:hypothetical protein